MKIIKCYPNRASAKGKQREQDPWELTLLIYYSGEAGSASLSADGGESFLASLK